MPAPEEFIGDTLSSNGRKVVNGRSTDTEQRGSKLEASPQSGSVGKSNQALEETIDDAAELIKANLALTDSLRELEHQSDSGTVPGILLQQITRHANAQLCYWFEYDPTLNTLSATLRVKDGELLSEPSDGEPPLLAGAFSADITDAFRVLLETDDIFLMSTSLDSPLIWPGAKEWHQREGRTEALAYIVKISERPVGLIGMGFKDRTGMTAGQKQLLRSLSNHFALAVRLAQLSKHSEEAAVARDRAAELAKSNQALQETTDALAGAKGMDEIVPAILRIIARVFGTPSAGFFEYDQADDIIHLRYWLMDGNLFTPDALSVLDIDDERFPPRRLTSGFQVPHAYLGFPIKERLGSIVVDHSAGTSEKDFDAWLSANDWAMELNVPLVVGDRSIGALTLNRGATRAYTASEIGLAEALVKQLTLAVQASRLAEESRAQAVAAAVAREQQKAADQRATELAEMNEALMREVSERKRAETVARGQAEALSQTILIAAQQTDIDHFVGVALNIITSQLHAPGSCLWIFDEQSRLCLHTACSQGSSKRGADFAPHFQTIFEPTHPRGLSLRGGKPIVIKDVPNDGTIAELREYYASLNVRSLLAVPIVAGEQILGAVNVYRSEEGDWPQEEIELAEALVKQIGLTMQFTSLAQEAKSAAVSREREIAAQERASELMNVNAKITGSFRRMSAQSDTSAATAVLLVDISQAVSADICYWLEYNPVSEELKVSLRCRDGRLQATPEEFEPTLLHSTFQADSVSMFFRPAQADGFNILSVDRQPELLWPGTAEWHRRAGRKQVLCFPVSLGDKPIGMLAMAFREETVWSNARKELVRALANHLALSTHLHGLSEQARRGAAMEERARLAREIHDTLAQNFSGILAQLRAMENPAAAQDSGVRQTHFENAMELASGGLAEARRSLASLRMSELDGRSFREALTMMAQSATRRGGVPVRVAAGPNVDFGPENEPELLRIAQESVTNALKHSGASLITIALRKEKSTTQVCIEDNGRGFDVNTATEGFGLIGMQERADRIGATITVESNPGKTTVCVRLNSGRTA